MRVDELASTADLHRLRPEWEHLWARAPDATPFQSPRWLLPWWTHLGHGQLAGIAVRDDAGELAGVAPLYIHRHAGTGLRHVFPVGIATTDDLGLLAAPGWEERVAGCVVRYLADRLGDWDLAELPQQRAAAALLHMAVPGAARHEVVEGEPSLVLPLRTPAGGQAIPHAMARNIRYYRRRASSAGALAHEVADAGRVPALLQSLVDLHGRRWSKRGEAGVLVDPAVQAAHREAAPLLQAAGLLRLHALCLDGEPIAVLYCLADGPQARAPRHYSYLIGFDPRAQAFSPGTLLLAHAIEQAQALGATAYDFLRGAEAYKALWGTRHQPMYTWRVWSDPARGSGA